MTELKTGAQAEFSTVWSQVWEINFKGDSWQSDPDQRNKIQQRLAYFNPNHPNSLEHIAQIYRALIRGVALTKTALYWHKPAIGQTSTKVDKDDRLRGSQWRLIIVYSGFEITTKALMNHFETKNTWKVIYEFVQKCELPDYEPLIPPQPKQRENLEKWLSKEEEAIAQFLGVNRTDAEAINGWIVQAEKITSWPEAVQLAKALRNASAHGFLLPNKIGQWGLEPGIKTLADNLGTILACGLKKLTEGIGDS
jgi:hypothetical protein